MNSSSAATEKLAPYPLGPTLRLRVPIVQAPIGAMSAGPRLCAEVSRAGALGCLTVNAPNPDAFVRTLVHIRARTPRPVLIALTAEWESETVTQIAFDKGFLHFYTFWWNGARLAPRIKRASGTVFCQVGSLREAQNAVDFGADVLVLQGNEAGGQVRTPLPLRVLFADVRAALPNIPLVASGGLANQADVVARLRMGCFGSADGYAVFALRRIGGITGEQSAITTGNKCGFICGCFTIRGMAVRSAPPPADAARYFRPLCGAGPS